jgi:hypothetical protein
MRDSQGEKQRHLADLPLSISIVTFVATSSGLTSKRYGGVARGLTARPGPNELKRAQTENDGQ